MSLEMVCACLKHHHVWKAARNGLTISKEEECGNAGHHCYCSFNDENPSPSRSIHADSDSDQRESICKLSKSQFIQLKVNQSRLTIGAKPDARRAAM